MFLQSDPILGRASLPTLHSLFLAVVLDPADQGCVADFTDAYARQHKLTGALRPRWTLHASLWSFADRQAQPPAQELVDLARRAGERVALSPFKATFNQVETWNRKKASRWPLVLAGDEGVIGLERLHDAIAQALGLEAGAHFRPHVTLMWGRDTVAPDPVRPLSFHVRQFALVHSHVGASHYDIVARFPLVYG